MKVVEVSMIEVIIIITLTIVTLLLIIIKEYFIANMVSHFVE